MTIRKTTSHHGKKGFTLVELLVVIATEKRASPSWSSSSSLQ